MVPGFLQGLLSKGSGTKGLGNKANASVSQTQRQHMLRAPDWPTRSRGTSRQDGCNAAKRGASGDESSLQ